MNHFFRNPSRPCIVPCIVTRGIGILVILFVCAVYPSHWSLAQRQLTPHTLTMDDAQERPAATIGDVGWLTGYWQGEALGGTVEAVWSPVSAHSLLGMFRLVQADTVAFYELLTVTEHEGSLVKKLKHFDADLTGWEAQDEVQRVPLVRLTPTAAYFDGLTVEKAGPDSLHAYVAVKQRDGTLDELTFWYRRVTKFDR